MDDLAAFLRAQWDTEEERARRGAEWLDESAPQLTAFDRAAQRAKRGDVLGVGGLLPDRVLADIAAKRRILDEHALVHRQIGWLEDGEEDNAEIPVCRSCVPKNSWYERRADVPEGHCATVRLLALPYADADGYRETWRP